MNVVAQKWWKGMHVELIQKENLEEDVGRLLSESYGDCAWDVGKGLN